MTVIEFPGREPIPEDEVSYDERHAEAFRDLEPHINDCVQMSRIAAQEMGNARCDNEGLAFAVFHTYEMLLNLKKYYAAGWDGEVPITRLITHTARTSQEIKEQLMQTAEVDDETPPPIA